MRLSFLVQIIMVNGRHYLSDRPRLRLVHVLLYSLSHVLCAGHTLCFAAGSPSRTILRAKDLRLVGETDLLEALALGHYAIVKRNVGGTAAHFSHHKRRGLFLRYIESLAVTVGGDEHAIVHVRVNGLSEN